MDLRAYDIDPIRGFLPAEDPLELLPPTFQLWEEMSGRLPSLMMAGRARELLGQLGPIDPASLEGTRQLWRAYLLLSMMANAYIMDGPAQASVLPRCLAKPLWYVARALDMPPVFTYAAIVLHNWSRIDRSGPVDLGNLVTLRSFLGGVDEQWFLLSMAAIEARGGPALQAIVNAQNAVAADDSGGVSGALSRIADAQHGMLAALDRLPEKCDPYIFFHRLRPVLDAWREPGVVYEGVSSEPQMWIAASGAQSALTQALDFALGVDHAPQAGCLLAQLRAYMPKGHNRFLDAIAAGPSLRAYILRGGHGTDLVEQYNDNINLLNTFRRKHMEIAVRYVAKQATDNAKVYGTTGSNFIQLLNQARKETSALFISAM